VNTALYTAQLLNEVEVPACISRNHYDGGKWFTIKNDNRTSVFPLLTQAITTAIIKYLTTSNLLGS